MTEPHLPPDTSARRSARLPQLAAALCWLSAIFLAYGTVVFSADVMGGGNAAAFIPVFFLLGLAVTQAIAGLRLVRGRRYGALLALLAAVVGPLGTAGLDPFILTRVPVNGLIFSDIAIVLLLAGNAVYAWARR